MIFYDCVNFFWKDVSPLFLYRIVFNDGLQHANNVCKRGSKVVRFLPAFMHDMEAVGLRQ